MFDFKNGDGANHNIYSVGGPWGFFSRMRNLARAQIVEDTDSYNRFHEMFQVFGASYSRANHYSEGYLDV